MENQTCPRIENDPISDKQAEQMTAYLEDLLFRQIQCLKQYDLEGSIKLAQESQPIADRIASQKILERPAFTEQGERIQNLYQQLCLVIASQRQEVSNKLSQVRTGLKTLSTYANK